MSKFKVKDDANFDCKIYALEHVNQLLAVHSFIIFIIMYYNDVTKTTTTRSLKFFKGQASIGNKSSIYSTPNSLFTN